jgi:hypothetical protein
MNCYPLLVMAMVLCTSSVANCTLADEQQTKAAPATQAQKDDEALDDAIKALVAAKRGSDFKDCEAVRIEFMHKHPNPTATERTEGYYLIAQCQERLRQGDEAMVSYAEAVTVGGELSDNATAAEAKQRLEKLYSAYHNGSLVGVEKVYKKAKELLAQPEK